MRLMKKLLKRLMMRGLLLTPTKVEKNLLGKIYGGTLKWRKMILTLYECIKEKSERIVIIYWFSLIRFLILAMATSDVLYAIVPLNKSFD